MGGPGSNPRVTKTLVTGNFGALEIIAMYFTVYETYNLPLFGKGWSRSLLYVQYMYIHILCRLLYIINNKTSCFHRARLYVPYLFDAVVHKKLLSLNIYVFPVVKNLTFKVNL